MKLRFFLIAAILCLGMAACTKEENKAPVQPDMKQQFESYLKFKRISVRDAQQHQRLFEQYRERGILADVIENEALLDKGLIQAELDEFRKEMLISRYFEKYLQEQVTDQSVSNYYNTHAAAYEQQKAHAAHILIRTNNKMSEPERLAKLTTAQEAYAKIHAGADFAEVAKLYSEDTISAKKGGDLGWLKQGSIDKRFSKAVFEDLQPGQVSEPFETPFGFHVVKVLEAPQVVRQPFEAVSGDIRYQLRNQAKQAEMERLLAKTKRST